ncbi:hypothetical protein BOX15_Mlig013444g1 [Macrostomum lignano]|uniref:Ferritin n=1 Tax=Macrostomum lignano TaxID=282301 RepID=A0A267GUU5_9PLAT|nr:hypothetical protein BOX15_Mlig013444g1 [Macrostomum lignano]
MSSSRIRQNFHEESEAALNRQVNMELFASYTYQSMSFHFARDDVALPGIAAHFAKESAEERGHAEKLMKLINQRGGTIVLDNISKPKKQAWGSMLEAMQDALQLERDVNQSLLDLHKVASKHEDAHLTDYLEGEFLTEQVDAIEKISGYITQLKRVGTGLGEYIFDHEAFS